MSLKVWIPGTTGTAKNQGFLQLPSPSYNTISEATSGKLGKAIQGQVCYHLSSDPCSSQWSVTCWSKFTSGYTTYNNIILCLNTADSEDSKFYLSIINNTTLNIGRGASGTVSYNLPGNFQVNTWYHLAATFDGTTTKLYLNGSLVNSSTGGSTKSASNLTIGGRSTNANGTATTGAGWATNDVRIYDHCLTASEVKEISKGLVAHYTLSQNSIVNKNILGSNSYPTNSSVTVGTYYTVIKESSDFFGLQAGDTFTVSYYLTCPSAKGGQLRIQYYRTGDDRTSVYGTAIAAGQSGLVTYTATLSSTHRAYTKMQICIQNGNTSVTSNDTFYVSQLKIEKFNGNTAYTTSSDTSLVYDSSGYCRNLTVTSTSNLQLDTTSPRYKSAIKFNGLSGAIGPSPFGARAVDELTVSFWHKPNSSTGTYGTIIADSSPHSGFWMQLRGENPVWYYGGSWYVYNTTTISVDTWYHIVLTYKNSTYQFYVNGQPVTTTTRGTFKAPTFTSDIVIGCPQTTAGSSSSDFRQYGTTSDVRLYATALSADDVKDLYNLGAQIS